MIAKVSFNIEPDRYNEFCSLLGQFAETLSGDSIIEHSRAYGPKWQVLLDQMKTRMKRFR